MHLFTITIEATAERTITLAAASLAEAESAALNLIDIAPAMMEYSIVEAALVEEAV